ncbi:Hypothetical predicted protein [Olea europaea subsp. europaea]|uniref:Uncharacterized protein n=1 Tax=Olea europaea subsp. europaea TaxID=158383 RepID=A0A8S0RJJ6_OLEEU|nr:Hypothetical predicted protein [Olea europaea subsp. europaea]
MLSKPSNAPFNTKNTVEGNPMNIKITLQAPWIRTLKVFTLSMSLKGTTVKHIGTRSSAPIFAVAKFMTDIKTDSDESGGNGYRFQESILFPKIDWGLKKRIQRMNLRI